MESAALADESARCRAIGCHERMPESRARCLDLNPCRTNVPVRFCGQFGEVVNDVIPISQCTEEAHAVKRRSRQKCCVEVWRSARRRQMSGECGNA